MDEYLPTSQSAKDALEQLSRHSAVTGAAAREIPGVSSKARTDSTPQQSPKEKEHSHVDAPGDLGSQQSIPFDADGRGSHGKQEE